MPLLQLSEGLRFPFENHSLYKQVGQETADDRAALTEPRGDARTGLLGELGKASLLSSAAEGDAQLAAEPGCRCCSDNRLQGHTLCLCPSAGATGGGGLPGGGVLQAAGKKAVEE